MYRIPINDLKSCVPYGTQENWYYGTDGRGYHRFIELICEVLCDSMGARKHRKIHAKRLAEAEEYYSNTNDDLIISYLKLSRHMQKLKCPRLHDEEGFGTHQYQDEIEYKSQEIRALINAWCEWHTSYSRRKR